MFPQKKDPKKKPGVDLMVAVAPHGSKPGLGAPMPFEKSMGKPGSSDEGDAGDSSDEEAPAHEAAESPAEEQGEDYGAKLMTDIDAVGKQYGADSETTRAFVGDLLGAISKCLKGESDQGGDGSSEGDSGSYA